MSARGRLRPRHRLVWRIWSAVVASIALFALLAGLLWQTSGERRLRDTESALAEVVSAVLPPAGATADVQQGALLHWRERIGAELALDAADGTRIAATRDDVPAPRDAHDRWVDGAAVLALPDGRRLVVSRGRGRGLLRPGLLASLALLGIAVAVGAWPVARRLTRRLEQLQGSVERLGSGDLSARVPVRGRDEVAQLAASFNVAAGRIEQLVQSHRTLLANASHELRSPLARVRIAVELLASAQGERQQALRAEVERGITEIDALIDEILLAARLDAGAGPRADITLIDLAALAAEECARAQAVLTAAGPVELRGDARLLRRLLRNLLENARRYGAGTPEVEVMADGDEVRLRVMDRGPGVPAAERERIFEPFYRLSGASETNGGVGLGLALVRRIAAGHGGRVLCLPRPGGGTTFEVVLPAAGAAAGTTDDRSRPR